MAALQRRRRRQQRRRARGRSVSVMVTPGHSGERTEVRLIDASGTIAIRYVSAELTTPEGQAELAAAAAELHAIGT